MWGMVTIRNGQVGNRPIHAAIGVTLAGEKDVLGLWAAPVVRARGSGWTCSPTSATVV